MTKKMEVEAVGSKSKAEDNKLLVEIVERGEVTETKQVEINRCGALLQNTVMRLAADKLYNGKYRSVLELVNLWKADGRTELQGLRLVRGFLTIKTGYWFEVRGDALKLDDSGVRWVIDPYPEGLRLGAPALIATPHSPYHILYAPTAMWEPDFSDPKEISVVEDDDA